MENLTPRQIVQELDKYIVGQNKAKRSVAVALRNRYRRSKLAAELQEEIVPKNIIMIGPTGVGKTEIARRLAKLVNAPFIKVEATKFTEVGYVGRDVESIVRDLIETSVRMVKADKMKEVEAKATVAAEERLLELLVPSPVKDKGLKNPLDFIFGGQQESKPERHNDSEHQEIEARRKDLAHRLRRGELEKVLVELEVEENSNPMMDMFSGSGSEEMGINLQDMLGGMFPKKRKKRKVTVAEARKLLTQEEAQKLIDMDEVTATAVRLAEQAGIVFLDEIDKIAGKDNAHGPDVSRGGVQRDILPVVEGSTVVTKYGPVRTDHMLFIAAGAFHVSKPSDLIPELQGRFPIRVELDSLRVEDFKLILTEPTNSLIKQYVALLETEGIKVQFSENAIDEIATMAYTVNNATENIGARRLHTILEKLLEDLSFEASEINCEQTIIIDKNYVQKKLGDVVKDEDLSRYIL
ncbi:MAG TPA: ATP-dependent protease ATPase subunit HslU [Verrucomicrobiae bacterium]|nr:ATP-dependent protease ATPase subunit HslU [Verrucomicrobiae bacterium]